MGHGALGVVRVGVVGGIGVRVRAGAGIVGVGFGAGPVFGVARAVDAAAPAGPFAVLAVMRAVLTSGSSDAGGPFAAQATAELAVRQAEKTVFLPIAAAAVIVRWVVVEKPAGESESAFADVEKLATAVPALVPQAQLRSWPKAPPAGPRPRPPPPS